MEQEIKNTILTQEIINHDYTNQSWMPRYYLTTQNFWGQNGNHIPGKLVWGVDGYPASHDFETKEDALKYAIEKGWHKSGQISKKQINQI